jgi:ABC-type phosphate transport system substrate-binding protein
MPYSWRSFRPVLLALVVVALCLPLASPLTYAQEGEPDKPVIIIQGTFERELDTLIENIRDAYPQKDDVDIQLDLNGPSPGFSALCAGEADLVLSAEPIDDGKIAECDNQNANFIETVIAYEAVVLLAPESSGVTCLDTSQVFETWALDAPAEVTWADLAEIPAEGEGEGEPLTFYGPQDYTPPYGLFAQFIPNTGKLREDIVPVEDVADILDTLTAEGEEPVNAMGTGAHAVAG